MVHQSLLVLIIIGFISITYTFVEGKNINKDTSRVGDLKKIKPPSGIHGIIGAVGNKIYYADKYGQTKVNWIEALSYCQSQGMMLASIESAPENELITKFIEQEYFPDLSIYWLSGIDFGREGEFYWMKTGKTFSYQNWGTSEPSGKRLKNCAYIGYYGTWRSSACTDLRYPLCMYELELV